MSFFKLMLVVVFITSSCKRTNSDNEPPKSDPTQDEQTCVTEATFSPEPGIYENTQDVVIVSEQNIRFTTDGSDPIVNGKDYSEAVKVSQTSKIKLVCVEGEKFGNIIEGTYTIGLSNALALVGQYPASDSKTFLPREKISFEFNKPIENTDNLASFISLNAITDNEQIAGDLKWVSETNTLTFQPNKRLVYGFKYKATLNEKILGKSIVVEFETAEGSWEQNSEKFFPSAALHSGSSPAKVVYGPSEEIAVSWSLYDNTLSKSFSFISLFMDGKWNDTSEYNKAFRELNIEPYIDFRVREKLSAIYSNGLTFVSSFDGQNWSAENSPSTEILLNDGDFSSFSRPIGTTNRLMLTWIQTDDMGGNRHVYFAENHNNTWSKPSGLNDTVSLNNGKTVLSAVPTSGGNDNGDIVISWIQYGSDNFQKLYMKHRRNNVWSTPEIISFGTNVSIEAPLATMDKSGNAHIAWIQKENSGVNRLYLSTFKNEAWTHPTSTNDFISIAGNNPVTKFTLVGSQSGKVGLVWLQGPTSGYYDDQVYSRYFDGIQWETPKDIKDSLSVQAPANYHYGATTVSADLNERGDFIVVWNQIVNYNNRIYLSTRFNDVWKKPSSIDETVLDVSKNYSHPTVALDIYRNRILTYFEGDFFVRKVFR